MLSSLLLCLVTAVYGQLNSPFNGNALGLGKLGGLSGGLNGLGGLNGGLGSLGGLGGLSGGAGGLPGGAGGIGGGLGGFSNGLGGGLGGGIGGGAGGGAGGIGGALNGGLGGHGGTSTTVRKQDNNGNYEFGYDIVDEKGAKNGRKEIGKSHGKSNVKIGSYYLTDVDGRQRLVEYIADEQGFRAKINSNEPGVAQQLGADVALNGQQPIISRGSDGSQNGLGGNQLNGVVVGNHLNGLGALVLGNGQLGALNGNQLLGNQLGGQIGRLG